MTPLLCADLGRVRYGPTLELQRRLQALRQRGEVEDIVLFLEHTPVITIGRRGNKGHILLSEGELARAGVDVFPVERGGDVTYHGPGQIVIYPILDLRRRGKDVHRYVYHLEEVMIRTARSFGVEAGRRPGFPGVWHDQGKLGAVGIHVRNWVTMHGLALNVDLRPDGFRWIVPCGIPGARAVSLAHLLGKPAPMGAAWNAARAAVEEILEVELRPLGRKEVEAWTSASPTG